MGNGQLAIMCVGSSSIYEPCRALYVMFRVLYYYCIMHISAALSLQELAEEETVLHKSARSTARGDVAGCILHSYLPLLSKRPMPSHQPWLQSFPLPAPLASQRKPGSLSLWSWCGSTRCMGTGRLSEDCDSACWDIWKSDRIRAKNRKDKSAVCTNQKRHTTVI